MFKLTQAKSKQDGKNHPLNLSLNYTHRKEVMRKVNNSNSVLMQSLKDIKPTLNHEEWVRHSKKVRNNESS